MIQDLVDLGVDLRRAQLLGEGVIETTWPRLHPHLDHSLSEWLNPATETCPQEVHACQPLLPQLLYNLMQGPQLAEVLPGHSILLVGLGDGVVTGECGKRCISVVPQVELFVPPPLHRSGYQDVEISIDVMPRPRVDNHAPQNCHFCVWVLWMPVVEKIVSQDEMEVNPHIGLTQNHKGRDIQDPRGGQIVQLQANHCS
jgi:hypothetical protein